MKQSILDILALLGGGVAVVAGTVSAAYWVFKLFGEKWLTAKFEERLAAYKHQQQKELEELRFKISGLLDRTTKLYQREFEVLPEAWGKLIITHGKVQRLIAGLPQQPDLNQMSAEQLAEFVDKSALEQGQKEELRKASNKTEYYQSASRWTRLWEVRELWRDYIIYERKNGIFIRNEIKEGFRAASGLLQSALIEYEDELQHGSDLRQWDARTKLAKEGDALLDSLEKVVQQRLWDSQTAPLSQTSPPQSS
jgi:hypothetical protein